MSAVRGNGSSGLSTCQMDAPVPSKTRPLWLPLLYFYQRIYNLMRSVSAYANCSFSSWRLRCSAWPWNEVQAQRNTHTCVFTANYPPPKNQRKTLRSEFYDEATASHFSIHQSLFIKHFTTTSAPWQFVSLLSCDRGFLFWQHNHPSHVWWWWWWWAYWHLVLDKMTALSTTLTPESQRVCLFRCPSDLSVVGGSSPDLGKWISLSQQGKRRPPHERGGLISLNVYLCCHIYFFPIHSIFLHRDDAWNLFLCCYRE